MGHTLPKHRSTVLESRQAAKVKLIALSLILSFPAQIAGPFPVTIEVKRNVEITHSTGPYESRGTLCLADVKAKAFRLNKGQRFQMVQAGNEGSCRIRFSGHEYSITSCPWLDGFGDHQTDVFRIVPRK